MNRNDQPGMTLIVKTVTRLTVGLILIYGIYIVLRGSSSPGGGFAGGVIIALSLIHLVLAFGKQEALRKLNQKRALLFASIGAMLFLILISKGLMNQESLHQLAWSDVFISFMVGCGLFAIFLALVMTNGVKQEK